MRWEQSEPGVWRLLADDFSGKAVLNETNSGYIAAITVSEEQFDMELLDEREFFPSKDEALGFLKEHMDRDSY